MDTEFDERKRQVTLLERGLDFAEASRVFESRCVTFEDLRQVYGEQRFVTLGELGARLVVIVWTPRGAARRIISMRKANEREQALYLMG